MAWPLSRNKGRQGVLPTLAHSIPFDHALPPISQRFCAGPTTGLCQNRGLGPRAPAVAMG